MTTIGGPQPGARLSFLAICDDGAGRQIGVAHHGTNGDSPLSRRRRGPTRC